MAIRVGLGLCRKRWWLPALAVLLGGGLAWGITGALAASESPAPAAGKVTLKVGWVNDPDNLNPFIGYESSAFEIWHLNYDMLVGYKAADGSPAPELAESWKPSADGRTWTFNLRDDVRWQDGQPFTAKDVAYTYNLIIDNPADAAALSPYVTLMKKAVIVDEHTVRFVCARPKANVLRLWIPILPAHIWGKISPEDIGARFANRPPIVGTGPFQCVEWRKGDFVRMVKNADYWRCDPAIDEILFQTYTNPDTMAQELKAGMLDVAYGLPSAQLDQVVETPGLKAVAYNTKSWEYLSFNCYDSPDSQGSPVLRDIAFRQAIAWAVDKQKCADLGWNGHASPGTTIMPPGVWPANWDAHYEPTAEQTIGFDLEKAGQMLDAAGYRDEDGDGVREDRSGKPIALRLWARSESPASQTQGKLIAGWFEDLGLEIEFSVMDDGVMSERLYATADGGHTYAPDYDMYLWDWVGYADPADTLACFTTDQIWMWNDPCWSNREYDRLAVDNYAEMDPDKRLAMIRRMQEIFYVEVPEIVVDYPQDLEAYNIDRWEGWVPYNGGAVVYSNDNIDTYLFVHPKTGSEDGGSKTTRYVAGGVATAAIVIAAVALFVRRRRLQAVEE